MKKVLSLLPLILLVPLVMFLYRQIPNDKTPSNTIKEAFVSQDQPQNQSPQKPPLGPRQILPPAPPLKIQQIAPVKYTMKSLNQDVMEIGTERHSPPKPYLKLNKWEGEANLKVSIPYNTSETPEEIDGKLRYQGEGVKVDFYPKTPEEIIEKDSKGNEQKYTINEEGGVEFDTILDAKPLDNKIVFPIETRGLKFYYQPALTQKEIDEGVFRPENVVGSYAVYHKSKQGDYSKMGGKNYMAGKAFHIYRPKIKDASGKEIWGNLSVIASGAKQSSSEIATSPSAPRNDVASLIVTIPQDFLNSASYPVTIDPNFGYETIGGSVEEWNLRVYGAITKGSLFTGVAGTATKITAYTKRLDAGNAKGGIYLHSDSTLIANGETSVVSVGTGYSWVDFSFPTPSTIEAVDYVLALAHSYANFNIAYYKYDVGNIDQGHSEGNAYLVSPATFSHEDRKYSIYATYTAIQTNFSGVNMQGVNIN